MSDNFWGDIDETTATGTAGMGGGNFTPIPEGTNVLAAISEIDWNDYQGETYIEAKWDILQPDEYKARKVFQKIKVLDSDPKKADKAKRIFAAIDKNASGGKLLAAGKKPTMTDMMRHLVGKPMVLKLGVWEQGDKSGNWVQAVSPRTVAAQAANPVKAKPKPPEPAEKYADYDDDVPF